MKKQENSVAKPDQEAIDSIVTAEADDDSAWEPPVRVKRSNSGRDVDSRS